MNFHCGFNTDLDNGLTVSVQFHDGVYARRDDDGKLLTVEMACWTTTKSTQMWTNAPPVEIVWLTGDVWGLGNRHLASDDVMGHVPVEDVMHMIDAASQISTRYVDVLAPLKETANMKREAAELKQEIEELKQEKDNLERERAESYDGII